MIFEKHGNFLKERKKDKIYEVRKHLKD